MNFLSLSEDKFAKEVCIETFGYYLNLFISFLTTSQNNKKIN